MSDNNIECYGELVSEVLTAISQVYWGRMYKYIKDNNIDYKDVKCRTATNKEIANCPHSKACVS